MKKLFRSGVDYVRKHSAILNSLILIFVVTGIIFFNAQYSLREFQKNTDALLQSKAVFAEDILSAFAGDFLENKESLQAKITSIQKQSEDIRSIAVLTPKQKEGSFGILASTQEDFDPNEEQRETLLTLAWHEDEGIAFLDHDEHGRFWSVVKAVKSPQGENIALVSMSLSLSENDAFVAKTIRRVYFVAIVSLVVVLLLVANHVRLFQYVVRAAKLEEVDRMKDEFISMASHELRSPLTAIRGYVDLLESKVHTIPREEKDQLMEDIQNIKLSAERLNDLVSDLLDVSRIEQGRLPIDMQVVDVAVVAKSAYDEIFSASVGKKLAMKFNAVEKGVLVNGDPARIHQILINLLSNAIKYTPKGEVRLTIKEDGDTVAVTIADTGLGISAKDMDHLFSKFFRIKRDETITITGTGLGLWISKRLAQKMDGDLGVESIVGVGSHFTLTLEKSKERK